METVNLYSDTQTRPTGGMRRAMAEAEVGDEQRFADPTTIALQERVAELLGHEAGLLLPTGTMCNLIGFRLNLRDGGDEVILDRSSHPVNFEAGSPAVFSGAMISVLDGDGGGRVWPLETVMEIVGIAREHDMRAHLDGARLLNAAVASGIAASDYASGFDTAWIDFTKGLGAPVGAVLAGSKEMIEQAWRYKQMLGGAFRQSGVIAAACLYALEHNVERLADDHANAKRLAEGVAQLPGVRIEPARVETNIVVIGIDNAFELVGKLGEDGIEVTPLAPDAIRCVTHLDVDAAGIERALESFRRHLA